MVVCSFRHLVCSCLWLTLQISHVALEPPRCSPRWSWFLDFSDPRWALFVAIDLPSYLTNSKNYPNSFWHIFWIMEFRIFHLGGLHRPLGSFASSAWGGWYLPSWVVCIFRLDSWHVPLGWFASSDWVVCIWERPKQNPRPTEIFCQIWAKYGGKCI